MASSAATTGSSQVLGGSGASSGDAGRRRLLRGDGTPVTEPAVKRQRSAEDAGQGSSRASGLRGTSGAVVPPPSPPRDTSRRQQQQQQQPQGQLQRAQERQQQQQVQPRVASAPQPREQQEEEEQPRVAPASQLREQQQQERPRVAPASQPREQQQQEERRSGLRGRWVPGASGLVLFCSLPLCQVLCFLLKASPLCCQGSSLVGWCPGDHGLGGDSGGDGGCGILRCSDLCQPGGARCGADGRVITRLSRT